MSRVLEKCKTKLLTQRKSDSESLRKLITETAREMNVYITETNLERAVIFLKYGKTIW